MKRGHFGWHSYDVRSWLPPSWQHDTHTLAQDATRHDLTAGGSITSREPRGSTVPAWTVDGDTISGKLPWLTDLYHGPFLNLARTAFTAESVTPATGHKYGLNLNVLREGQRYEAHVDTGLQGLLFLTTHGPGDGGELAVSNRGDVWGTAGVDEDATIIRPTAGHLIFFDARGHTHYVRGLTSPDRMRIVAPMSFYAPWAPECARPADLEAHIYG